MTLEIRGPRSSEDGDPNPFLDYRLAVTFTRGEASHDVPGYFAADGDAANTGAREGDVWRAHFVPDRPGKWSYRVSLRQGPRVALSADAAAGRPARGDGLAGSLEVAPAAKGTRGLLRYVGRRYLEYAGSGEIYLKSGADSPENFLAYVEFDGDHQDRRSGGSPREGEAALAPRHHYEPHVRDWRPGDPTWRDGRGKGIVGALNYLASRGVNSIYFLTMNIQGDGKDVWPYRTKGDRFRFDTSKLEQWEVVFRHMDRLGIQLHVVLTETENESLFEVEEGGVFAERRKLYYRELVARFSHHQALVWNLGEENGWDDRKRETTSEAGRAVSHEQRKAFASSIRRLDPHDHPIVVHTLPGRYEEIYRPLLGHPALEGPSLQVHLGPEIHRQTIHWIDESAKAGRSWVVTLDEIGPANTGVKPDSVDPDHFEVRHHALWGHLMAGGAGCEWYFGYKYPHNDLNLEDFRSRENVWKQTRIALEFFRKHLPLEEMAHADRHVKGEAFCFAKPGHVYALYVPAGAAVELWLPDAAYDVVWYDPRAGGELEQGTVRRLQGAGYRSIGRPPVDPGRDWAVRVKLAGAPPARVLPPPRR